MEKRSLSEVAELINEANIDGVIVAKKVYGLKSDGNVDEYLDVEFEEGRLYEGLDNINRFLLKIKEAK